MLASVNDWMAVARLVSERTGLSFANRLDSAEHGIARAMARAGIADAAECVKRLAFDEGLLDDLLTELTVGETYFFREPAHFKFIQRDVIPDILRRRGVGHSLRVWSAGCATGEESYTLAMLFEEAGLAQRHSLIATDISRSALAKARRAVFSSWSLRGESAQRARPYLTPDHGGYRLDERIRCRVTFAHLNLALDAYPSFAAGIWGLDLILCRNVLIYLDRATVRQVAQRLYRSLADGGWLLTASSDPPLWEDAPFEVVSLDDGLFYRRPGGAPPATGIALAEPIVAWVDDAPIEPVSASDCAAAPPMPAQAPDRAEIARDAFARGDFARVVEATADSLHDEELAALHVRALANVDPARALAAAARATGRHPLAAPLHHLHAVLLLDAGHPDEAAEALRRVLYLDRTLAVAHFTLGAIARQRGDLAGAARAYRNARACCLARPAQEPVPLADGETAGRLAEIAAAELALLEGLVTEP